jgi:hypothetical protein
VRHQATRPSFTVEVKRRRSKSPHPFITPQGHLPESLPREGLLAALKHEPPAQHSVDWSDLIKVSPPREHTPSFTGTPAAESTTKFRTGRILPDVLGAQVAAERIQQEANERAVEGPTKRSKVNEDARPRQPMAETRQVTKPISSSKTTWTAEVFAALSTEKSEQPRADVLTAECVGTASSIMSAGSHNGVLGHYRDSAKDKRLLRGAQRRAKRRGMQVSLRRGERWKRRLPEVCW